MNKKGFATAIVDFYATLAIVLIIIIFFVVLHFKTEKATTTVTGEHIGLDATQIALLYAQATVETSLGRMSFAEFLIKAAEDKTLQKEFTTKTEEFFDSICTKQPEHILYVTIDLVIPDNEERILTYVPCKSLSFNENACTASPESCSSWSNVQIPLKNPKSYVLINIRTIMLDVKTIFVSPTFKA